MSVQVYTWWRGSACRLAASCLLAAAAACSAPPPRDVNEANAPFALVRDADRLTANGDYDEATRKYLLALDDGRQRDSAFVAARSEVVRKLTALGRRYPPARAALAERSHALAKRISLATDSARDFDGMDVMLFVLIARDTGNESEVRSTYASVRARLPSDSRIRIWLGGAIEDQLVQERRYTEAVEEFGSEIIDYYLNLFQSSRSNPDVRLAIEIAIANEGGAHYEALLGAGRRTEADSLAERLIEYAPTAKTLAVLADRARRAGAVDVESRVRARAQAMGLTLPREDAPK